MEPGCIPAEIGAGVIAAVHSDGQLLAQIDAEHLHKAFAIYLKSTSVHCNGVGAGGGYGYEILHILYGFQFNFQRHVFPPRLYKQDSIVYNWGDKKEVPRFTHIFLEDVKHYIR